MRSLIFNIFFLVTTLLYAIVAVIFSLVPGRWLMMGSLSKDTRVMLWGMRTIAGPQVTATGP